MASASFLKLSVLIYLIQQSTSDTPTKPVTCAAKDTLTIWGSSATGFDLSKWTYDQPSADSIQWIGRQTSRDNFQCEFTADHITFGSVDNYPLQALIGKIELADSSPDCISDDNPHGVANIAFDANSALQLCKQLGYQTGSAEKASMNFGCPGIYWSDSKWVWDKSKDHAKSITCEHPMKFPVEGDIESYDSEFRKEKAIPVGKVDGDGETIDTKDQVGIPRLMEAVSYLDFRRKVNNNFKSYERNRQYTFIIRAATPYTIEYMDEESVRRINNGKYGHTSMLTESERVDQNQLYDERNAVVIFAGGFHVDGGGKIDKWNCQSGHFNPYKKQGGGYVKVDGNTNQAKLYDSAPVIAKVFGFPEGDEMKCKSKSSSSLTTDYWNEYGDDAFDDDRLFEEYDRIITDYLLSQEARDNLKRAPWTVTFTGKDLIILLLMALTAVTIMTVCCECARTKGYGTSKYNVVRTVGDFEMDSEEITLQQ